jgi:hypothetical protein
MIDRDTAESFVRFLQDRKMHELCLANIRFLHNSVVSIATSVLSAPDGGGSSLRVLELDIW